MRELARIALAVVLQESTLRRANIESPRRVFQHVRPEWRGRLRQTRQVGLEPTTSRLTADCSTIELLPNKNQKPAPGRTRTYNQPVNPVLGLYH